MAQNEPTLKEHKRHIAEDGLERQEVTYINTEDGSLILLICPVCRLIEAHCDHSITSWDFEDRTLTCTLCGIDCT